MCVSSSGLYDDAPRHMLVIPTGHDNEIFDMPPALLADFMAMVQGLAKTMRTALDAGWVNILHARDRARNSLFRTCACMSFPVGRVMASPPGGPNDPTTALPQTPS